MSVFFLFLVSDKGQQKYGGWTQAGKERYMEIRNLISAAREVVVEVEETDDEGNKTTNKVPKVQLLEEAALEVIQKRNFRSEPTEKPQKRKREVEELEVGFDDE